MATIELISEYRDLFLVALIFVLLIIFFIVLSQIILKAKELIEDNKKDISKEDLQSMDYSTLQENERSSVIRRIVAPDAVNPGPDDHLIVYDSVKKVYARSLTISSMAKRVNFANTFVPLFNFPDSTHSVFVEPMDETRTSKKLDRHLIVLEAEYITANGDSNRQRKLQTQYSETNAWAAEVETGKNKFFRVGFLFTLYANSLEELTKKSDKFRTEVRMKGMEVSACAALQSEAYVENAPLTWDPPIGDQQYNKAGVCFHYMDKFAVSTIYNYTSSSFSHRDGIPLGRNRDTLKPFIYDPYHSSFNGYTFCMVGKTGTGKSATIKIMSYRLALLGYRFASLDVQPRQGTGDGEYAGICALLGGLNFDLRSDSDNCLNIFEVMETKRWISTGIGKGFEKRTLDLNNTIAQAVNLIQIMISENGEYSNLKDSVLMKNIILNTIKKIYAQFGIVDGDPDSLYHNGTVIENGEVKKAKVPKPLPTISDFFKVLLQDQKHEKDEDKLKARKIVILAMEDYVRDLYYTEGSLHFFTESEFLNLETKLGTSIRLWRNPDGYTEEVRHIHGTRGYYDGQSTLRYTPDIPWVNIDCSQLDEASKKVAMAVGQNYLNERLIKGNSENRGTSSKIMIIFDESHMIFKIPAARTLLAEIVRTARKRNVALAICTQTLREFEEFEETTAIRKNAASLFVFKQDNSDKKFLIDTLGLTVAQVEKILEQGGNLEQANTGEYDEAVEAMKAKHRGEVTIVINKTAIPVKVDYRKRTEKHAVETAASEIIEEVESA